MRALGLQHRAGRASLHQAEQRPQRVVGADAADEHGLRARGAGLHRDRSQVPQQIDVGTRQGRVVEQGQVDVRTEQPAEQRPEQRGSGIYRALTAARAALALGRTLMHSDSTERSRPILERSGLVEVPTTTRYVWQRAGAQPT